MYALIRPFLFKLDAETAHDWVLAGLKYIPSGVFPQPKLAPKKVMGITFPHAIGLAAGLDKNGDYLDGLAKLGFSFIEIGTVTPKPQFGNPKPRLFRLPEADAIINLMGFNNKGVDFLLKNLSRTRYRGILGINIGKNKDTPLERAHEDYLFCLRKVYAHASYITVNISSPNTPDLRQLQSVDFFRSLLNVLREEQLVLSERYQRYVPLVVKLSPDESDESLKRMADVIVSLGVDGVIATNTTSNRAPVSAFTYGQEAGGLSGAPLASRATECIRVIKSVVGDQVALIGVGGIDSAVKAQEKLDAGADLLQIYTGLIYQGPSLVKRLTGCYR